MWSTIRGGANGTGPRPDETGRTLIRANGIVKTYRSGEMTVPALRGVSLEIQAGEFVAIVGPSGTGKSTLMNCLSGIDTVDSGTVIVDGLDIHALSDRRRTEHRARRMGFVFQGFNLIPVLNAVENVELPLLAASVRPAEARERAHAMLARVGLTDRAKHRPGQLSGGQRQRVAIARALVGGPAVIWADEPTGNLDSSTAAAVVELFAELNEGGQTIVIVTHDDTVATCANRTIELIDGRVATVPVTWGDWRQS